MTMLRDLSIIYCSIFSLVLFFILFDSRYPMKKTLPLSLAVMGPLLMVNFALMFVLGPEKMSTLLMLTCSLPSLVFFFFLAKRRDGRFFFTFCLADTLVMELMYGTMVLDYFLGNSYIFMVIARFLGSPILAWLLYKKVRPVYLDLQTMIQKGWNTFTAISLILYALLSLGVGYPSKVTTRPEYLPSFILLLILTPAIYIHIFRTLLHQQHIYEIAQQDSILQLQVENLQARMAEYMAMDEKHRIERHNFRHSMQAIASLVDRGDYDELHTLAQQYCNAHLEPPLQRYCPGAITDAVLSSYLQHAKKQDIRTQTKLRFPDPLPVDDAELATVFANAIENAIQACQKLEPAQRYLTVETLTSPRFMMQISNSYNGEIEFDKNGVPISRQDEHGFGTRSIVAFCQKNGAEFEFKATHEKFSLRIIF